MDARAPYAADPGAAAGGSMPSRRAPTRSEFRRDGDRIIHSTAFRRLKHKTQVFVFHEGDHYRTRLTHTLEVTQIARALARALGLDEDLAEALALAHDLGHPPFGHAGERALDACLADFGGFDHNAQTLRVVTAIERRYAGFDGLNLTWETLEGHGQAQRPADRAEAACDRQIRETRRAAGHRRYDAAHDSRSGAMPAPRRRSRRSPTTSPTMRTTSTTGCAPSCSRSPISPSVPVIGGLLREVREQYPGIEPARPTHELVRRLIGRLIEDVRRRERAARCGAAAPTSADEVRAAGAPAGRLLGRDGRGGPRHQGVPLRPTCIATRASSPSWARPRSVVRDLFAPLLRAIRTTCRRNGRDGLAGADGGSAARRGRRFHRRHDRSVSR